MTLGRAPTCGTAGQTGSTRVDEETERVVTSWLFGERQDVEAGKGQTRGARMPRAALRR